MKIKDSIGSEFDDFSKDYTNDMIKCVPYYMKLITNFGDMLPLTFEPQHILDLGCGNGNVTDQILKKFPDAHYTLLDISQEMLNLCQQRFKNYKINYVASYFQDFEFVENRYDLVVGGFSLHHCTSEDKKSLFKKIFFSLKPGGVFSCSDLMINKKDPNHAALLEQWQIFVFNNYENQEKWEWLMEHYNAFDRPDGFEDQKEWLTEAGFNRVNIISNDTYWIHCQAFKD